MSESTQTPMVILSYTGLHVLLAELDEELGNPVHNRQHKQDLTAAYLAISNLIPYFDEPLDNLPAERTFQAAEDDYYNICLEL